MAKPSGIHIKGLDEFKRKVASWTSGVAFAAEKEAFEWGSRTMAVSKSGGEGYVAPIVPVDTGALMSTGHFQTQRDGSKVKVVLGYGGPSAPYAAYVHEVDANYKRPNSGKDYLRLHVEHMKGKITEIASKHLKEVLK